MRQPEIRIFRDNGAEIGIKKVMSMHWDNGGQLRTVTVDFMEDGNSNDFTTFHNYTGEFTNIHGHLKGGILYEK